MGLEGDCRAWPRGGNGPGGKGTSRVCSGAQSTGLSEVCMRTGSGKDS